MTRSRAQADGTPSDLAAQYYSQRAAAGLIITEATAGSKAANGAYVNTPGNYGCGVESVAPSAIAADMVARTPSGKKPLPVPRALATDVISPIVEQFRAAARRAIDAGVDGVEIHGANGYLLHHFQSDSTNQRTDAHGGSPENRARLTAEIVEAVATEIGPGRVVLRISPGNTAGDMQEADQVSVYEALLTRIAPLDMSYLHVLINPDDPAFDAVRGLWFGPLVLNTGRDTETSFCQLEELAEWGVISAAAVERSFLANPDLIDRLRLGAELNEPDVATFYTPGPVGYVDYPTREERVRLESA